ncbi:MAG: phosphatidate cytidylyltransferase [Thermoanaerobaculia bacterium]
MAETSVPPPPAVASRTRFTREITSLVAAPLIIWIIGWAPHAVFVGTIGLISGLALLEFLVLGEKKGYPVQKILSILLMFFLLTAFIIPHVSVELGVFAVLLVLPAAFVFSRSSLEAALPATAVCVLGTLYVGMLAGSLIRLRLDFPPNGAALIFFLLLVVWLGDAGAYYVGSKFGKHKLSPRVSPKKTVEGGIGGVATSVTAAIIIHFTFFPAFPLGHAIIAAAILSVSGIVGDLAESLWKRSAAVKDSGALIPGHGGFLDRFDSILFTAPILYAYWFLLTYGLKTF